VEKEGRRVVDVLASFEPVICRRNAASSEREARSEAKRGWMDEDERNRRESEALISDLTSLVKGSNFIGCPPRGRRSTEATGDAQNTLKGSGDSPHCERRWRVRKMWIVACVVPRHESSLKQFQKKPHT